MKIKRHSLNEKSKITAMWLYEFAHDLDKNAQNIDYLREYLNKIHKDKKFGSIDEKMADFRERLGFDLTIKIVNEMEKVSNEKMALNRCECKHSSSSCACSIKTAMAHPHRDVELMRNILTYIKDMVQHEPHLDASTVISRCKQEDGLRYNDLESKIDKGKLIGYVKDLLGAHDDSFSSLVSYIPSDSSKHQERDAEDSVAEYYNHAEPNLS